MNHHTETRVPIRSVDFSFFEKPRALPHWSFDEKLRTRTHRKAGITLADALAALAEMSAQARR